MIGAGTKFYRSDDGVLFERVSNILELTPQEETRTSSEKSYLDSESGYKEFEPGMTDPGELSLALEFDINDVGQEKLKADKGTKTNIWYRTEYPDASTDTFKGHITGWGKAVPKEETIQRTVKFKLSGEIVEAKAV